MLTKKLLILFLLKYSLLYSQNNVPQSIENNIIPIQITYRANTILHLGGMKTFNEKIRYMAGIQFQPTKNLILGGIISPFKINSDLSIYYNISIGFITKWKLLNISSNMFQIGMHRNRFDKNLEDIRWYSFSIIEKANFGRIKLNLCWNRLFNNKWKNDSVLISTDIKINNKLLIKPGAIFYLDNNDWKENNYFTPFLTMSVII